MCQCIFIGYNGARNIYISILYTYPYAECSITPNCHRSIIYITFNTIFTNYKVIFTFECKYCDNGNICVLCIIESTFTLWISTLAVSTEEYSVCFVAVGIISYSYTFSFLDGFKLSFVRAKYIIKIQSISPSYNKKNGDRARKPL